MPTRTLTRSLIATATAAALLLGCALSGCDDGPSNECAADADCPGGERCNVALDVPVCQALGTGAEWTPCSSDDLCESARCLVRASSVCVEPGWQRHGEACERDEDCMSNLVCHTSATCETVVNARRTRAPRD